MFTLEALDCTAPELTARRRLPTSVGVWFKLLRGSDIERVEGIKDSRAERKRPIISL